MRVTSGLVLSDRILREDLFTTPDRAYAEGLELAKKWHGVGRTRYAVTPRFALSCTDALLESAGGLLGDVPDAFFTSHVNENREEIAGVRALFGSDYASSYDKHGLLGPRSRARAQRPSDPGRAAPARTARGRGGALPDQQRRARQRRLPPRRAPRVRRPGRAGLRRRRGRGVLLFKEGLQAYFCQQLLGAEGHRLTAGHLLHLATAAGAPTRSASPTSTGDLSVGKEFDALWLRPEPGTTLDVALRHADSPDDALAKAFALAGPADVRQTWVAGTPIRHAILRGDAVAQTADESVSLTCQSPRRGVVGASPARPD